ncbi:MAG: hypothetical protein DMG22_07870 [Acidobacteria bacterium]|nr:MAG: hypothetical protein DMG22_07870 [Acidobacteriota bacterium]
MTVGWAGLIYYLSTQSFGVGFSEWLLHEILRFLHVHVSGETFNLLHILMRKGAHTTEYAIFCAFLYSSFSPDGEFVWRPRVALTSLSIAVGYSLSDEFHQLFVPGRTSSLVDSGIDTLGAAIAILLIYLLGRKKRPAEGSPTAPEAAEPT